MRSQTTCSISLFSSVYILTARLSSARLSEVDYIKLGCLKERVLNGEPTTTCGMSSVINAFTPALSPILILALTY